MTKVLKQKEHIGHWIFVHPLQENDPGAYMCSECKTGDWDINPVKDKVCKFCGARMLPPAQPQLTGQWIPCTKNGLPLSEKAYRDGQKWYGYKCSNCNFIYKGNALTESPYCKKCGARMEESGK